MFARRVSLTLKTNSLTEFSRLFEREVLPLMRKQPGFSDELVVCREDETNVTAISLWDSKQSADNYAHSVYPWVLDVLAKVLEGKPRVRSCTVINAMSHKQVTIPALTRTEGATESFVAGHGRIETAALHEYYKPRSS